MLKTLGWILGGIVLFFAGIAAYAYFKYFNIEGDFVADFIQKNPSKATLYWMRNDTLVATHEADKKMPLASTVKTLIAIEFAQQAASGKINPEEQVPLSEPGRFYIPDTDGGAHPQWLKKIEESGLEKEGTVSLLEIARGMIRYSSNANTEYLMWKLGLDNINANLSALGMAHHDSLYPFISALYVCSDENSSKGLSLMPRELYLERANQYFEKLQVDTTVKATFTLAHVSLPSQRVWSDRLPGGTAREYGELMKKIQSRAFFAPPIQEVLEQIMEWPMEAFDSNRTKYQHLGAKGGSTAFVLTYSLYATDLAGNKTQLVFFFNGLTPVESSLLQAKLTDFQNAVLIGDAQQRSEIAKVFSKPLSN
jgi:D-alanyl-D-alanine carboxypeptidase